MAKLYRYMSSDRKANLIGVFFLALLVFNFPFLAIFGKDKFLFGIPILYTYIFVVWLTVIVLVFINSNKKKGE